MAGKANRNTPDGAGPAKPGRQRPPKGRPGDATGGAPDLSHIAEGLRPLAVPVAELAFMVGNPRTHDDANLSAIQGRLAQFGQLEALVVNRRPSPPVVIGGNGECRILATAVPGR